MSSKSKTFQFIGMDLQKGSIEKGKAADLTILNTDLITCEENEILNTKVLYTIVDGEIVYEN